MPYNLAPETKLVVLADMSRPPLTMRWDDLAWKYIGPKSPEMPGVLASLKSNGHAKWDIFNLVLADHILSNLAQYPREYIKAAEAEPRR